LPSFLKKTKLFSFISFCFFAKCFAIFRAGIKKRVFVPGSRKAVEATLAFLCHVHLASTCPPATTHRPHPHPLPNERQHSNACQFLAFPLAETLSQVRLTYALLHTRYQGSKSPCFAFCLPTMHGGKEIPSKIAANGNFFKKYLCLYIFIFKVRVLNILICFR